MLPEDQRQPGWDAAGTAELTVLLTRGAPTPPSTQNSPARLCVTGNVTGRAHKQIPALEVTQTQASAALPCRAQGAGQDTLDQLHQPGHAQGTINPTEQLQAELWAGTDPSKEHLSLSPSQDTWLCSTGPSRDGCWQEKTQQPHLASGG